VATTVTVFGDAIDDNWLDMTRLEVETRLGPPGDYRSGPTHWANTKALCQGRFSRRAHGIGESGSYELVWETDSEYIVFEFNADNRVTAMSESFLARDEQSTLDNLLWRLKRQWHRWFPE
jgi:hypothetical protein